MLKKKDGKGHFLNASGVEVYALLANKGETPKKRNHAYDKQTVLQTALQGKEKMNDVSLEEMGL